ncbi:hypothetical protein ACKGJI_05795 [Sulfurospirillum sp. 1307]
MKIKEFFKKTKKVLHVKPPKSEESKKERLKELLKKLQENKAAIKNRLKNETLSQEIKKELEDELEVYNIQIKKGEKILAKKEAEID